MATVVVTGGAGKLGRACVTDLAEHGWQVVVFDQARADAEVAYVPIDLTDYGQVLDAMLGVEERYQPGRRGRAPRRGPGAGHRARTTRPS